MKKRQLVTAALLVSALFLPTVASADAIWYNVTFTGANIWTYSLDNALQAPSDQTAPRRYRDFTDYPACGSCIVDTTYGLSGGTASTAPALGFGSWAPTSGFAFDSINLWGAGGAAAAAWGENYVSVGNSDPGAEGVSSWKVIQSPVGWSSGIVKGNDPWSADATHAFPVWRSAGTSDMLGISNMFDPAFVFEFQVLADSTAFTPDGKLRVFFGGFSDDVQGTGPDNHEVSGVMELQATAVPEPATLTLVGLGFLGLGARKLRARKP
jgi:PEP-CTERM motif